MAKNAANQQTQGSATGSIQQMKRDGMDRDGIVSGMTQRLAMSDGEFVPKSLTKDINKKRS